MSVFVPDNSTVEIFCSLGIKFIFCGKILHGEYVRLKSEHEECVHGDWVESNVVLFGLVRKPWSGPL